MSSRIGAGLVSLDALRSQIQSGGYKRRIGSVSNWGGADLIVTPVEIDRESLPGKVIVVTAFTKELSWLINELRDICASFIDYFSKYRFYPRLGERANAFLSTHKSLADSTDLLLAVLDEAAVFVRECD